MLSHSAVSLTALIVALLAMPLPAVTSPDACHGLLVEGTCFISADAEREFTTQSHGETFGTPQLVCPVDDSPYRIQVLYAYEQDNRLAGLRSDIELAVAAGQRLFDLSSARHDADNSLVPRINGTRTGQDCTLDIEPVHIPEGYNSNVFDVQRSLADRGYDKIDLTYLVFWDRSSGCGTGLQAQDSDPNPQTNQNNGRRRWAHNANVTRSCLGGDTVAHELLHTMGAVQPDAPNATSYSHCVDGNDLLCYDDGSPEAAGLDRSVCPEPEDSLLADCNGDDYFSPGDASGYLSSHWNVADSWWLQQVPRDATLEGSPQPSNDSYDGRFRDDDGSIFERAIEWLAAEGITAGCNPPTNDRFCPDDPVTRGQMAAFLTRALDLPPASQDRFIDDDNSVFEAAIQALAQADVTRGCNPPTNDRFCPDDPVTRGQMAAFLQRALT